MSLLTTTTVPITYLNGQSESLPLARLTIRQLYQFTQLLGDEKIPQLVCLCLNRSSEWLDSLTDDCFATLAQTCLSQNFPRAMTLAKSEPVIASRLTPLLRQMQAALPAEMPTTPPKAGEDSKAFSTALPPTALVAAITNDSSTTPPTISTAA